MMNYSRKVLLAEDDKDDQIFFRIFLNERTDISLLPAVMNGAELINTIQDASELPDLIILDQNMPKLNGLQTLQYLKSNPRYTDIPVILYSTYIDDNLINEGEQAGAAYVVSKPTDKTGYNKMMDEILAVVV
jgi:CheY-like chemotaxis protein